MVALYYGTIIGLYFFPSSNNSNDKDVIVGRKAGRKIAYQMLMWAEDLDKDISENLDCSSFDEIDWGELFMTPMPGSSYVSFLLSTTFKSDEKFLEQQKTRPFCGLLCLTKEVVRDSTRSVAESRFEKVYKDQAGLL